MNTLSTWILSVMLSISPYRAVNHPHESEQERAARFTSTAIDIERAVGMSDPLFKGKDSQAKTAALVTAVAFMESGFSKDVDEGKKRGDGGSSWCHMQLHIGNGRVLLGSDEMKTWTGKDLIADRVKCFRAGIEVLRVSMASCSKLGPDILSQYTTGRCIVGQHEARTRWGLYQKIVARRSFPDLSEKEVSQITVNNSSAKN